MADNTQLPVPNTAGDIIATDDIGGVKYQRVKLIHGAEGVNDGDVSTRNAFPVNASNVKGKFRESFEGTTLDSAKWTSSVASNDYVFLDGNTVGTSYVVISKSPLDADTETYIESIATFEMPSELSIGYHMSQRTTGQDISIEVIDTDEPDSDAPDINISSISQSTTTLTVNTATKHGLVVGKAIGINGAADSRVNFPQLVVASTPSATQFTCTAGPSGTITSQTVSTTGGYVYFRQRMSRAKNGLSQIFENTNAANASAYVRSASGDSFPSGTVAQSHSITVGSTASIQTVNAAYNYGFTPTTEFRIALQADRVNWLDSAIDSTTLPTNRLLRTQVVPDPEKTYKIRFKSKNTPSVVRPIARIVSISKSGTTTATVTTDVPHGLTTTNYVNIYGVRDQTNFANLTSATVVASTPTSTTFTIILGSAVTATSYGGYVAICNGNTLMSQNGAIAQSVQSVSVTSGVLTLIGSAAWSGLLIGDTFQAHGVNSAVDGSPIVSGVSIDGAYKVRNISTTTLEAEPIDGRTLNTLISTNCGGGVIKRTDMRISFVRFFDYERLRIESAPRSSGDTASALPVFVQGGNTISSVSTVSLANLGLPSIITDVASAALTSTTTTSAVTPTFGTTYIVSIPVTAVSGTSPTLDTVVQESDDSGTNWYDVYHFPRITATGAYRSPPLTLRGNRIRYVQTVTGTSPSFTRTINRLQRSDDAPLRVQFIDRTIVPNTLNSVTPTYYIEGCLDFNFTVRCSAQTTPATMTLRFSNDGTNWFTHGTTLSTVVGVAQAKITNEKWKFCQAIVTVAGTGITLGEAVIVGVCQ